MHSNGTLPLDAATAATADARCAHSLIHLHSYVLIHLRNYMFNCNFIGGQWLKSICQKEGIFSTFLTCFCGRVVSKSHLLILTCLWTSANKNPALQYAICITVLACGQTDARENITFPHTSHTVGNKIVHADAGVLAMISHKYQILH